MILNYEEIINKYKSKYYLKKALENKEIFKIDSGLYSFKKEYNYLELIFKKYPKIIISGKSAFFYLNLTDEIPSDLYISTSQKDRKITNNNIIQTFESNNIYRLGLEEKQINGVNVKIYNKERMLIELIRNKSKYDYVYYKNLILEYRKIADELDMYLLNEYLKEFKKGNCILKKINEEVF